MPNDFGGGSRFACVSEGFQLCRGRTIPTFYGLLILMDLGWIFLVKSTNHNRNCEYGF